MLKNHNHLSNTAALFTVDVILENKSTYRPPHSKYDNTQHGVEKKIKIVLKYEKFTLWRHFTYEATNIMTTLRKM